MTVNVSHQVCESLCRDTNSLSQSTRSRRRKIQKIKDSTSRKTKAEKQLPDGKSFEIQVGKWGSLYHREFGRKFEGVSVSQGKPGLEDL